MTSLLRIQPVNIILVLATLLSITVQAESLSPGDHTRTLMMGEQRRTYLVHIPKGYDPKKPTPVVLALHGAMMNGALMARFCGLSPFADQKGFIVVYPSGTGFGPFLTWNAGGFKGKMAEGRADDVAFISKLLDDLASVANVDEKRVYACGMSNGAMMCYRLAAELSERIVAIAPVAGTIAIAESKPKRAVPVIHFHGTKDGFVPYDMAKGKTPSFMKLMGVEESIQTWVKLDGCNELATTNTLSKEGEAMKVTRRTYGGGKNGAEVVLVVIEDGGHTWPGMPPMVGFLGKSATNISANELLWNFFQKFKLKGADMPAPTASEKTLFDAKTATSPASQIVNDGVMGGVSSSRFEHNNGMAMFRGVVSLENNGGFASVRLYPAVSDLTGADAFLIRVRGDGRRYKFMVRTKSGPDGVNYQSPFVTTKGAWEKQRLPFAQFVASFRGRSLSDLPAFDPAEIETIGFLISDKQAGAFQLEIDWIKAVKAGG